MHMIEVADKILEEGGYWNVTNNSHSVALHEAIARMQ